MSVVFVVTSEKQLDGGAQWCRLLATSSAAALPVHAIIVDVERKTLAEFAKRKLGELLESSGLKPGVELATKDSREVLAHAASLSCTKLLLIYDSDEVAFQSQLFIESMFATIWLGDDRPPSKQFNVSAMFSPEMLVTTVASEQLLGQAPSQALCDKAQMEEENVPSTVLGTIESEALGEDDLVLCGVKDTVPSDRIYQTGLTLLKQSPAARLALVHTGHSWMETIAFRLRAWAEAVAPPMERDHRIELANDLQEGSKPNLEFLGLISAASMLAAFGLLQDSAAVIIGAMLIAPLMTPILGAGLALTQGNQPLFRSSLLTITFGFFGAIIASMSFGWLYLIFHEPTMTSEMLARCRPSPLDFCVGMVGGVAASYARTRRHLSSALAGAAIAAALVPPLSTAGLQVAFGHWRDSSPATPIIGPLLLVTVNVLMIMIGSSFVLWARGMRVERMLGLKDRWVLRAFALLATLVLLTLIWVALPATRQ